MTTQSAVHPPAKAGAPQTALTGTHLNEREALGSLRVLICVARADGVLTPEKRIVLERVLTGLDVPGKPSLTSVMDEKIDLDAQLRAFTTSESRETLYQSALGMVHVHHEFTPAEHKMLERIRTTLRVREEKASLARRVLEDAKNTVLPSSIQPTDDPVLRATEVKADILKYSVLSGVLGAVPIPGVAIATDLAVVGLQVKLVRDIGQRWGHKVDKLAAVSLLGGLSLGTGARIAVSNLAKLVPVWGSVVGATSSFATTWALGHVADTYFESGMKATMDWDAFKAAEADGRKAHDVHMDLVGSKRRLHEMSLQTLGSDLKAGRITQQDYSARVEQLA